MLKLEVKASDPDGDSLNYRYFASAGRISGEGAQVNWDLRKAFGRQEVRVEVRDKRGAKAFSTIRITVVPHGACDPSPCTPLQVFSAPGVIEGAIVNFIANIRRPASQGKLEYRWSQTNGKIIGGQGTRRLRVKATGLPGTEILATVNVGGLDPACNREASGRSRIKSRE
jgi:hypothetical protein